MNIWKGTHTIPGCFGALSYSTGWLPFSSLLPQFCIVLGKHVHTHTQVLSLISPETTPISSPDVLAQTLEPRASTVVKELLSQPSLHAAWPIYFTDISSLCYSPGDLSKENLAWKYLFQMVSLYSKGGESLCAAHTESEESCEQSIYYEGL